MSHIIPYINDLESPSSARRGFPVVQLDPHQFNARDPVDRASISAIFC